MCVHQSRWVLYNQTVSVCGQAEEEKTNNKEDSGKEENCVNVQMSMSM